MTGTGDHCQLCTVLGSSGRVPEAAAASPAAAVDASLADTHAAAAHGLYAACSDSTWGPTATAFALACSACHHYDDSSSTAQWASELGIASSSVCFTHSSGVPVVVLTSGSPAVHAFSDGLHTRAVILAFCA